MAALDKEIEAIKKELHKISQLKMDRKNGMEDCMKEVSERVFEQSHKFKELSTYLKLPD